MKPVLRRIFVGVVGAAAVVVALRARRRLGPERYHLFDDLIARSAAAHRLDVRLLRALVRVESDFQPRAVSWAGAMGLTQIMPGTARRCGVTDPFDPAQNLDCGARTLRQNLDRFVDLELALAAYNAGPGRALNPPAATVRYVARVLRFVQAGT